MDSLEIDTSTGTARADAELREPPTLVVNLLVRALCSACENCATMPNDSSIELALCDKNARTELVETYDTRHVNRNENEKLVYRIRCPAFLLKMKR